MKIKFLDSHVHFAYPITREALEKELKENDIAECCIVTIPNMHRVTATPEALAYKYLHSGCYVFTCLDLIEYFMHSKKVGHFQVKYLKRMMLAGCDGVKILEGKPDLRKALPIPDFDSARFLPLWQYLCKNQIPVTMHLNDPEIYWDKESLPDEIVSKGLYYDETYIKNEDQYTQMLNVLMRFPTLKICFSHFMFLADYLESLGKILDEFPNVYIDIAPGVELYRSLSKNKDEAKDFFNKYKTRIIYGSDMNVAEVMSKKDPKINFGDAKARTTLAKNFLIKDGPFKIDGAGAENLGIEDEVFNGLGLSEETLTLIASKNFLDFAGSRPKTVLPSRVKGECIRTVQKIRAMLKIVNDKKFVVDYAAADSTALFFDRMLKNSIKSKK